MAQTQQTTPKKEKQSTTIHFRPLGNRVLLRRLDPEETLKGGIILPDSAKKKQEQAEVIAVGPGKKDKNGQIIAVIVKVGDTVLIEKYSGQDVTLQGEEFVITRADDLIAVIEK